MTWEPLTAYIRSRTGSKATPPLRLLSLCTVWKDESKTVMPPLICTAIRVPLRFTAAGALSRKTLVSNSDEKVLVSAL